MRISDCSSDVCSSDMQDNLRHGCRRSPSVSTRLQGQPGIRISGPKTKSYERLCILQRWCGSADQPPGLLLLFRGYDPAHGEVPETARCQWYPVLKQISERSW